MIRRTLDPAIFNRVCNHPEVRPWLGGEGELDLAPLVSDPRNYALATSEGGFILVAGPGASFEVHSQFTPEGRRNSFEAMRAGMDYMFTRTPCLQLTTFLPDANRAAKALGLKGGFRPWFRRSHAGLGEGEQARIDIDQWIVGNKALEADGERFHDVMEAAKADIGSILPTHDHDATHERYVGAALRMFSRGQVRKAEAIYNRWAANAGYAQIAVVSESPPVVDAVDAVVTIADGELQVLQCR